MHPTTIESMRDQVRAIYRAVTAQEMPEEAPAEEAKPEQEVEAFLDPEEVARRFVELEAMARAIPAVAERVPPFTFVPAMDAVEDEGEILFELAVPGVGKKDIAVQRVEDCLLISGIRRGAATLGRWKPLHAEIPCGPFYRLVQVPFAFEGEPNVEIERGLVRIRVAKPQRTAAAAE